MVQLAGGAASVQVKPMALEDWAVAARLVGAEGAAVQLPPEPGTNWITAAEAGAKVRVAVPPDMETGSDVPLQIPLTPTSPPPRVIPVVWESSLFGACISHISPLE